MNLTSFLKSVKQFDSITVDLSNFLTRSNKVHSFYNEDLTITTETSKCLFDLLLSAERDYLSDPKSFVLCTQTVDIIVSLLKKLCLGNERIAAKLSEHFLNAILSFPDNTFITQAFLSLIEMNVGLAEATKYQDGYLILQEALAKYQSLRKNITFEAGLIKPKTKTNIASGTKFLFVPDASSLIQSPLNTSSKMYGSKSRKNSISSKISSKKVTDDRNFVNRNSRKENNKLYCQ